MAFELTPDEGFAFTVAAMLILMLLLAVICTKELK